MEKIFDIIVTDDEGNDYDVSLYQNDVDDGVTYDDHINFVNDGLMTSDRITKWAYVALDA